jgi:hypothetical protein
MLLYLAGVNEHAGLRIVGSKRWRAHFLRQFSTFSNTEFATAYAAGKHGIASCLPTIRDSPKH